MARINIPTATQNPFSILRYERFKELTNNPKTKKAIVVIQSNLIKFIGSKLVMGETVSAAKGPTRKSEFAIREYELSVFTSKL